MVDDLPYVGAHDDSEVLVSVSSRAQRLFEGWSANLMQLVLGITQQVALVPVFLHFWTGETLAAWLAICAAGNLVLVADAGLQLRAINRFLSSSASTVTVEPPVSTPRCRGPILC